MLDHNFWGKKQLAYNVNKEKYGNYVLLHTEFNDSNFVNDFKAFLNLNSEVLKYLIIKLDGKPIPKEKIESFLESARISITHPKLKELFNLIQQD